MASSAGSGSILKTTFGSTPILKVSLGATILWTPPVAGPPPFERLLWMEPKWWITGTGVKTFSAAAYFGGGTVESYSLDGAPSGVTISNAGVVSVNTATPFPETTVTIRATGPGGSAETTVKLWVFTPTHTIASQAAWSSIGTPAAGSIVAVRGGTYTQSSGTMNISPFNGTSGARTKVVAYPGETVTFNCQGAQSFYALNFTNAAWVELWGFTFTDNNTCNFAIWNQVSSNCRLVACEFTGFKGPGFSLGQGSRAQAGPWTLEHLRVHNNVRQNENNAMGGGGWARGGVMDYCDNSVLRYNRFYQNWGEGFGTLGSRGMTIEDNILYDNWSVNLYLDNAQTHEVHRNLIASTDPTYYRDFDAGGSEPKRAAYSIRLANEGYSDARQQATLNNNVTGNRIWHQNALPEYATYGSGPNGIGGSVLSPNDLLYGFEDVWA